MGCRRSQVRILSPRNIAFQCGGRLICVLNRSFRLSACDSPQVRSRRVDAKRHEKAIHPYPLLSCLLHFRGRLRPTIPGDRLALRSRPRLTLRSASGPSISWTSGSKISLGTPAPAWVTARPASGGTAARIATSARTSWIRARCSDQTSAVISSPSKSGCAGTAIRSARR